MMRRKHCAVGLLMLSVGVFTGWQWRASSLTSTLQARPLDREEVSRLHQELDADSSPLIASGRLLAKVAELTTPSVVHIQSIRRSPSGRTLEETGSGVLVTHARSSGVFVVSNRHVVSGARPENISIHLSAPDGRVLHPTKIWTDKDTDVAVMRINAPGMQTARWGNSETLEIGHMVVAMGSPFGLSQSVTFGIVSAKARRSLRLGNDSGVLNQDFIQTDAAINPGNSGGPLIDMHGRVVGINTAIASNSGGNDGIGFSIPSNLVRKVVDELLRNGRVRRAYLGVKLDPEFTAEAAARFRLDRARGARIVEIYANTPAANANLEIDDVILKFDTKDVEDENHLINLVSLTQVDRTVTLEVLRNGRTLNVKVQLGDRAELEKRSETSRSRGYDVPSFPMRFTVSSLDAGLAVQCGLAAETQGLLVTRVAANSRFADTIQLYDVIEEIGRKPIHSVDELQRELQNTGPTVMKVNRDGVSQLLIIPATDTAPKQL